MIEGIEGLVQRRIGAMVIAVAAAALVLALPATASAKCKPGVHKYGTGRARTFCGKAKATVSIGGHKSTLKGGSCRRMSQGFTLNIGTILLGVDSPKRPDYFGISIGRPAYSTPAPKDGTYTGNSAIAFVLKHKKYGVLKPTVTLTSGRTKGSFSGTLLGSGAPVSGTFSCG